MAFVQRQRRLRQRSQTNSSTNNENQSVHDAEDTAYASLLLSPGTARSDSDNDWHIISTALRSSSRTRSESHSPGLYSSDPESTFSFRPSDTECNSDFETSSQPTTIEFSTLPAHDGTGAFLIDDGSSSDATQQDENEAGMSRVIHRLLNDGHLSVSDFESGSPGMPNILLPHGGIKPPSFVSHSAQSRPLWDDAIYSGASVYSPSPSEVSEFTLSPELSSTLSKSHTNNSNRVKFAKRKHRDLDRIPSHHPAIPGTLASAAILSAVWDHLCRLTSTLLEYDASASDTFSSLVSEAALDGCLPFGSHLHMDFGANLLPTYASRPPVGNLQGI